MRTGLLLLLALSLAFGCAPIRPNGGSVANPTPVADETGYKLGCLDVLDIRVRNMPEVDCLVSVDVDGRISLGERGQVRVDGLTTEAVQRVVARELNVKSPDVGVRLVQARSTRLFVHGPERNRQLALTYVGAESIGDVIHRMPVVQSGCIDYREITVVRPNVACGEKSVTYRIKPSSELMKEFVVQPGDHIYLAESRRSSFYRLLPEWLKPFYGWWMGVSPTDWLWNW